MTRARALPTPTSLLDRFIGLDGLMNYHFPKGGNFPPYNVLKTDDSTYVIEMALAGYSKDDLTITEDDNVLSVATVDQESNDTSDTESDNDEYPMFIYHGIAKRSFTSNFRLSPDVNIHDASMENGMLRITLKRVQPESTSRLIEIN